MTEGMVAHVSGSLLPANLLVRRLACRGGPTPVRVCFDPRRGPQRRPPRTQRRHDAVVCSWGSLAISLSVTGGIPVEPGRDLELVVEESHPLVFAMAAAQGEPLVQVPPEHAFERLCRTDLWWRTWSSGSATSARTETPCCAACSPSSC